MDPAKQKEVAAKGGRAAHAKGTAHEFTSNEARIAGLKGGHAVQRDRAHMSEIGRRGGYASRGTGGSAQDHAESSASGGKAIRGVEARPTTAANPRAVNCESFIGTSDIARAIRR